ncbi:hypothetical protein [Neolewinella sp.]|uniref:hypothetical protein n=1 Tax=Neolewinella sp. TaxID=2993543 RepID=UPI003B51F072
MKLLRFLPLLLLSICSCSPKADISFGGSDLIGSWDWVSTSGGFTGRLNRTPASTGTTVRLDLLANGRYTIAEDSDERSRGTYTITMQRSIYSGEEDRYITYSEDLPPVGVAFSGIIRLVEVDRLTINDNSYDGIGSLFVRR